MKTMPMREFLRSAKKRNAVNDGREWLLTVKGKPFLKVAPPPKAKDFIGAGVKHSKGKLTPWDGIPASEWGGLL